MQVLVELTQDEANVLVGHTLKVHFIQYTKFSLKKFLIDTDRQPKPYWGFKMD